VRQDDEESSVVEASDFIDHSHSLAKVTRNRANERASPSRNESLEQRLGEGDDYHRDRLAISLVPLACALQLRVHVRLIVDSAPLVERALALKPGQAIAEGRTQAAYHDSQDAEDEELSTQYHECSIRDFAACQRGQVQEDVAERGGEGGHEATAQAEMDRAAENHEDERVAGDHDGVQASRKRKSGVAEKGNSADDEHGLLEAFVLHPASFSTASCCVSAMSGNMASY
jgi:hypothetical protein